MSSESESRPAAGGFLFNVNSVFISTVVAYGISFLAAVLLARVLGPEGRGVTALYQQAVGFGFALASLGIASAIVYFVARRDLTSREALESGLSVTIAATALTAAIVGIAALLAGESIHAAAGPYWLAVLTVPAIIQFRLVEGCLRAQERFGAMNVLEVLLTLAALVGFVLVELTIGLTVGRAIAVWSASFLPPTVLGYVLLGTSALPRRLPSFTTLRPTVRFGFEAQLGNLLQALNYRLDSYLVLAFVNTAGVGLYAVGVQLSEGMWFIANSVAVVFQTNLTARDDEYAARNAPIVCRNTILVTALAAIAAGAVSPFVVPLVFGSDFDDAVLPFVLLLPGTVALAGTKILAAYVFSRGRPLINAVIAFAALVVTVVADLILIPLLEVEGAAIGASLGYTLSLALTVMAFRALSGGSIADALLPRPADAALYVDAVRSLAARLPLTRRPAGPDASGRRP